MEHWRRRCDLDGPTIAHHLFGLFSPEAIEEGRRKGEMYGTRMLVVCGRPSSLCWRFVVLNRDTRGDCAPGLPSIQGEIPPIPEPLKSPRMSAN